MQTVTDFVFFGSKITVAHDWSHEIKRPLLFGKKTMTNLLKGRDITLLTKVHAVKVMVFPIVMYRCDSWTIKKTECRRIDAFKFWHWRRPLRVPWTSRRSNQLILKEISPEYSLEGLILWPPDVKSQLTGKDPDAGKDWRQEEKLVTENEMVGKHHHHSWLNGRESDKTPGYTKGQGSLGVLQSMGSESQTQFSDWTTTVNFRKNTKIKESKFKCWTDVKKYSLDSWEFISEKHCLWCLSQKKDK